jgi:hypothetical protein
MHIRAQAPPFLSAVSAAHSYPAGLFKSTVGIRTSTVRLLGRVAGSVAINSPSSRATSAFSALPSRRT